MKVSNQPARASIPTVSSRRRARSRTLLDHVMSKWGVLVLLALSEGEPLRWSELRRRARA